MTTVSRETSPLPPSDPLDPDAPSPSAPSPDAGELWTATVEGLGFGLEGWARLPDGRFVSIPHALPGDQVEVRLGEFHRGRAWAEPVRWLHRSPQHHDPSCDTHARCTGCPARHLSPDDERAWKLDAAREILQRHGPPGAASVPLSWIGPEGRHDHRVRATLRVKRGPEGQLTLGIRAQGLDPDALSDLTRCPAQSPPWRHTAQALAELLRADPEAAEHLDALELRTTPDGHALLLATTNHPQARPWLARVAHALQLPTGILDPDASTPDMLLGDPTLPLSVPLGGDEDAPLTVMVPWQSWYPTWPLASQRLARWTLDALRPHAPKRLLDLCCGVGTVTLAHAPYVEHLLAVDQDHRAVAALQHTLDAHGLTHAHTRAGKLGSVLRRLRRDALTFDAAIVNPMRQPLGLEHLQDLPSLGVQHLLYLGPAPASAAKDARVLHELGFQLQRAAVANLHPATARFLLALVWTR